MNTRLKILLCCVLSLVAVAMLLGAGTSSSITVKGVWIYPYETQAAGYFTDATVIEKTATVIKFKVNGKSYEHCGHYLIEN